MKILLILCASAALVELLAYIPLNIAALRKALATIALFLIGFAAGGLVMLKPNIFSVVIALLSVYRMINMMRIVEGRMHEGYLRHATRRTGLTLILMQIIVVGGWLVWSAFFASGGHIVWTVAGMLQAAVALALFASLIRNLHKTKWPGDQKHLTDQELPTVTVAIPARNETEDLQECLQTLVANDYPKLEIIVLDDCSQLRRTPEIIKDFAQAGVRFIQGREPDATWLAKNQAYQRLLEESTGQYVLFCGVDMRFQYGSVRKLVTAMLVRNKQMMCILPQYNARDTGGSSLVQSMRYWWELVLPRRQLGRPPVLSSCWVITRDAIKGSGGFAAVARAIVPEAHFARKLLATDSYSFMRSSQELGITSIKQASEQRETAVRMRYPQLHRRPEMVALVTFLEFFFLVMPFVMAIAGFWVSIGTAAHLEVLFAAILVIATYEYLALSTHSNQLGGALITQRLAVLVDIGLLHYSMWKYEFSTVDWKGRNVCVPVMHVVPRLSSK